MKTSKQVILAVLAAGWMNLPGWTQEISQEQGADQRVDYLSLTQYGPWDDRNYAITLDDLTALQPLALERDREANIPAFFRIELRRRYPQWQWSEPIEYPREIDKYFRFLYGGLMQDGRIEEFESMPSRVPVPVTGEIQMSTFSGANEVTVEINPVFPSRVIAGANNIDGLSASQEMYYSDNGGDSWTRLGFLAGTCCDPTLGWSSDGMVAYAAALSDPLGVNFYRSTDFGESWEAPINLVASGADKEFLHVDLSPSSPHLDNVYLTWHEGTILQFARSTNRGISFQPKISFNGAPTGIGSDITTDTNGDIYYFYPATAIREIILLKSTDGGVSFAPPQTVATTNGSFIFPIPSMETRQAWIYVSAASDTSGGPFDGSIYAVWTDTLAMDTFDPNQNHTAITFAYSRDGGATWNFSTPHETADGLTVDRYNQWMTVDELGTVHLVFYDTRNSVNRTGVDFYYTFSQDGGVTWNEPQRVSSQTSDNLTDNQEWGDYNGISVAVDKMIGAWTDNRTPPPNGGDAYTAKITNVTAVSTFILGGFNLDQSTCAMGDSPDFLIDVTGTLGFSEPVSFTVDSAPPGVDVLFLGNPTTPPGQLLVTFFTDESVVPGDYQLVLRGSAEGVEDRLIPINFQVSGGIPEAPVLQSPANGTTSVGINSAALQWNPVIGAGTYRVQVSTSPNFNSLIQDTEVSGEILNLNSLTLDQVYFWRVASRNACGDSAFSSPFLFVTSSPPVLIVDQDQNNPNTLPAYTGALDNLGVGYEIFDVVGSGRTPMLAELTDFPVVIWFTGFRFSGPTEADTSILSSYLDQGGNLFFTSQDYFFPFFDNGLPVPTFAVTYLGVADYTNDGADFVDISPVMGGIFDGLPDNMVLNYPFLDFADSLVPGTGNSALTGDNTNVGAVSTSNTVFFGFPFSAIAGNGTNQGDLVMQAILSHLDDCLFAPFEVAVEFQQDPCVGFTLDSTVTGANGEVTYSWFPTSPLDDPTIADPSGGLFQPRNFVLTVTDASGCTAVAAIATTPDPVFTGGIGAEWLADSNFPPCVDSNSNGIIDMSDLVKTVENGEGF